MWVARVLERSDDKRKPILHRRTVSSEKQLLAPLRIGGETRAIICDQSELILVKQRILSLHASILPH
jgi:hypothetical protein